ncbi:tRNA (adenine(37)-N6)-methyltransferase [Aplochiton taeniatus]
MSAICSCSNEDLTKLNQQSALSSIQQVGVKDNAFPIPQTEGKPHFALEQGIIQTVPIGYISSCFSVKNGTPRQPTLCGPSRATLRIQQRVFNNPEHSLVGLENYSHVWVIFLFHKNGHLSYKAKVKPPRLNGQRVGVYSSRSPHRPNALGLTLAKLDSIDGDTLNLSEIDMIAGTPVLDIKPYIPDYDSPHSRGVTDGSERTLGSPEKGPNETASSPPSDSPSASSAIEVLLDLEAEKGHSPYADPSILPSKDRSKVQILQAESTQGSALTRDLQTVLQAAKAFVAHEEDFSQQSPSAKSLVPDGLKANDTEPSEGVPGPCYGEEAYITIAGWIREPPVASLEVRFTPSAEKELWQFLPPHAAEPPGGERPRFKFLRGPDEAVAAIRGVLSADPRSVYRRTRCADRLFFFTLDTADIACWFGEGFAEVLRVRPATTLSHLER